MKTWLGKTDFRRSLNFSLFEVKDLCYLISNRILLFIKLWRTGVCIGSGVWQIAHEVKGVSQKNAPWGFRVGQKGGAEGVPFARSVLRSKSIHRLQGVKNYCNSQSRLEFYKYSLHSLRTKKIKRQLYKGSGPVMW